MHPRARPEPAPSAERIAIHQVHRRPLGADPVLLQGGLGALALLVAIVLLAVGSLVGGLILLAFAVGLLTLFFGTITHDPHAPAAKPTIRTTSRVRSHAGLAAVGVRAWGGVGVTLLRIRHRQYQLRSELESCEVHLGAALDPQRTAALERQAAEIRWELGETERRACALIAAARRAIEQEQRTAEATEVQPLRS